MKIGHVLLASFYLLFTLLLPEKSDERHKRKSRTHLDKKQSEENERAKKKVPPLLPVLLWLEPRFFPIVRCRPFSFCRKRDICSSTHSIQEIVYFNEFRIKTFYFISISLYVMPIIALIKQHFSDSSFFKNSIIFRRNVQEDDDQLKIKR